MEKSINQSKGKKKIKMSDKHCNKIGILTWHQFDNFGSALQAAALVKAISDLGYDASIINYRKSNDYSRIQIRVRQIIGELIEPFPYTFFPSKRYRFLRFREKFLKQTAVVTKPEIVELLSDYRVLVCGSDQIWAPNVLDTVYMADFIDKSAIRKVSYAASIGLTDIPDEMVSVYKQYLSDFSHISVREEMGQALLKEKCGLDSIVVIDPTLLISEESYIRIEKSLYPIDEKYIFCYFLSSNTNYREVVSKYAEKNNLKIYGITNEPTDSNWMSVLEGIGPQEFIWLVHNAKTVFTDSYHGTIFSLLFKKDFYTFKRFSNDDPINQNSRIYQLDQYFKIGSRFICYDSPINEYSEINYDSIGKELMRLREVAKEFLTRALKE